jgi:prepilin-type N-terminal cleavage/methylation domain-containing protein
MKLQKGFTLVEVIVVMAVIAIIMTASASLLVKIFTGSKQQYLALDNIDNARIVSSRFVNEIRSAVPGVDGSAAIFEAGNTEIIFHSPERANPTTIDRIRYFISDNVLYKGVVVPTGVPLSYNLASETVSAIQPDLSPDLEVLFYYYDGDYGGDAEPLSQPVNINDIRFARINLIVLKQASQGSDSVFSLSTGATVRSLKNNLGD